MKDSTRSWSQRTVVCVWLVAAVAGCATPPYPVDPLPVCNYVNPKSKLPECREYFGPWQTDALISDCENFPLSLGVEDNEIEKYKGTVSDEPCDKESSFGNCTVQQDAPGKKWVTYYYDNPSKPNPDKKEIIYGMCADFFKGEWEGEIVANTDPDLMTEAYAAMVSDTDVTVTPDSCKDFDCIETVIAAEQAFVFQPKNTAAAVGLTFLPGGTVEARAYAPLAHELARRGYLVALIPMPSKLSMGNQERVTGVMAAQPQITKWFLGGHSDGAAAACQYLFDHPTTAAGLTLLAGVPIDAMSLANQSRRALVLFGSVDGIMTPSEIEAGKPYLPATTLYTEIKGGNHAQFGYYGIQDGDGTATITREEQQSQTATALVSFMGTP